MGDFGGDVRNGMKGLNGLCYCHEVQPCASEHYEKGVETTNFGEHDLDVEVFDLVTGCLDDSSAIADAGMQREELVATVETFEVGNMLSANEIWNILCLSSITRLNLLSFQGVSKPDKRDMVNARRIRLVVCICVRICSTGKISKHKL